nr:hypothetical protein [Tanacetum cinerariifolium]
MVVCSVGLHAQPEDIQESLRKILKNLQIISEELAEYINSSSWNYHAFYDDDDDDEEISIPLRDIISKLPLSVAITPDFSIMNSLSMGDEHLNTIPKTKSDKLIKSSVENLIPNPSESEDLFDIESECNVPVGDDFTTVSNPLFDADNDFSSSDEKSSSDEDVLKEIFKNFLNHLFDEEIISTKIDSHYFNAKSDLIESLLNRDTLIVFSPKFDSLLEEFSSELAHIDLISLEFDEADLDPEEEIRLVEKLFDSLMKEIDIFLAPDDSMPLGIENDDYDSKGDILFPEEWHNEDSLSLPENESFHFDVPSSPRPPAKPPDDDEIYFDDEPVTGLLTTKVVVDISKHYVFMPRILPTQPTLCPVIDILLSFSSKNKDKVHLLSH